MTTYPTTPTGALDAGGAFVIGGGDFAYGQDYTAQTVRSLFAPPVPTPTNAIPMLKKQLSNMPLEALQFFKDMIPDAVEGAFDTVAGAVEAIVGALTGVVKFLTENAFTKWVEESFGNLVRMVQQVMDILSGLIVVPINAAVQGVKDFINGIGTTIKNGASVVQQTLDGLWGGFLGLFGIGKSAADVANAAKDTAAKADTGVQIGEWNNAVLGIRNNKAFDSGMDPTGVSMFSIPAAPSPGAEPPAVSATAAAVPIMFWIAPDDAKRGSVMWFGKGNANITAFYIDVYRMDKATSTMKLLHSSPDLYSMLSPNWKALRYNMVNANRVDTAHGDVLAIAFRVAGTGTHQIAGRYVGWQPADPSQTPQRPSAVRTGVGDLAFSAINYSGDIPVAALGIVDGDVAPPYFAPRTYTYGKAGSYNFEFPSWANKIDVVLCGAGSGGVGGNGGTGEPGYGGLAGSWFAETLVRGVDFPVNATSLTINVGAGGYGGGKESRGGPGGDTFRAPIPGGKGLVKGAGAPQVSAGYPFGFGAPPGKGSGDFVYNDVTYSGSQDVSIGGDGNGTPGQTPGGGGGNGRGGIYTIAWAGGPGGDGTAYITVRQS
ncbi:minor tail protein [Mycobacterium phage Pharaoh]|uniref:Minor tail protein n=1 Tax=Mycobacterium phage Pharaoh TaxID=2530140 RepID=A0A481W1X0_9CAUD|nr:minor tail protein [Mycobacterium phage Pharaoh]QBJ00220.1 minor tail protein [Mycobacterium phage Pharaoh]